jgi:hypothetical protein
MPTKQDDESPPSRRFSLDSVTTELRVERMILECRALGIQPDARTIAEIMVDDDIALASSTADRFVGGVPPPPDLRSRTSSHLSGAGRDSRPDGLRAFSAI